MPAELKETFPQLSTLKTKGHESLNENHAVWMVAVNRAPFLSLLPALQSAIHICSAKHPVSAHQGHSCHS